MTIQPVSFIAFLWAGALGAIAHSSVVGTWAFAAADKLLPHATRIPHYGENDPSKLSCPTTIEERSEE
jgi:hypothetical protein